MKLTPVAKKNNKAKKQGFMNKQFIVRKNEEIELIVKRGRKKVSKYFILYYIDSEKIYNQYCVSVSKKLGKAHIRNKIKRRIKDILMKNKMEFNKKYVIIIRKEALLVSYKELEENLIDLIKGAN